MRRQRKHLASIAGIAVGLLVLTATPAVASHAYGDARHWTDGNQPRAYVTINDHTPAGWPVLAATNNWGTEPNIDVYYNFGGCGGTGHCVDVDLDSFTQSCGAVRGVTIEITSGGHYTASTYVRFNSKCSASQFTNTNRRSIACHELGHVMGLGHDENHPISYSCMTTPVGDNWLDRTAFPGDHDFAALHNVVYSHNDN